MQSVFDIDLTFPHEKLRVGLIGSHCVGKTKQAIKLGQTLRTPIITECVRHMCAALGYKSIADVPDKVLFQWKVLQWQIRHEEQYERFISDRSTVDNAAYFLAYSSSKCSRAELDSYMRTAERQAKKYTHLIYFPVMWDEAEDDGFRDTDSAERLRVDGLVRDAIAMFGIRSNVYQITKDDMKDGENARLMEILQHLQLYQTIRELNLG